MDLDQFETLNIPEDFLKPVEEKKEETAPVVDKRLENLSKARAKKKQAPIIEERERLPRTNRDVKCIFCESLKTLNPDQYQSYFDYWGSEEKIEKNFCCKECEVKQNENPYRFWLVHHELTRKLIKALKATFELYKNSAKGPNDGLALQNTALQFLSENKIGSDDIEFVIENQLPVAIKVKHVPFVGTIELTPYNETKIKFHETI